MRGMCVLGIMIAVGVFGWTMGSESVDLGDRTCEDSLVGKTFTCEVKGQDGSTATETWQFTAPGTVGDFDLRVVEEAGVVFGCSCRIAGSFNDPDFDQSRIEFLCVSTHNDVPEAVAGRVTLLSLLREIQAEGVQAGAAQGGRSSVYTCEQ
jgi:hypothetical protein